MAYVARMNQYYTQEVVPALQQRFGYHNVMQVPRLEKIVLNMGLVLIDQPLDGRPVTA